MGLKFKNIYREIKDTKNRSKLLPNVLQQENYRKLYHEILSKQEVMNIEERNVNDAYDIFTNKVIKSAQETLKVTKRTMTPKRKAALKRLVKARKNMSKAKEQGIDTEWFKTELDIRREHFKRKIIEHNEAEITKFFNNLQCNARFLFEFSL